jgi:hypothetical protein
MIGMAKNSGILDKILEVVDTFTPTENGIYEHTFSHDGINGVYFIVTDPPGNIENMLSESNLPGPGLLNFLYMFVYGSPSTIRTSSTYTYRPNVSGYADYWSPACTISGDTITINLAGATRLQYRVGYTYYLCRVKQ